MIRSSKASLVAHWVKVFGTYPDGRSSIPESPCKEEKGLLKVVL